MNNQQNKDVNRAASSASGGVQSMTDQVAEKAREAKDAAADFGRRTVDGIDAQRLPAAAALDHTASNLQEQADRVTGVVHAAAGKLRTTADYVRKNNLKAMGKDVEELVRRYPGQALVAAAVIGFFVARAVRPRA